VLALLAATLVTAALWLDDDAAVPTQARPAALADDQAAVYVVQPGDTLWTIARRLEPSGDVRATVDALVARHGSASIQVGDRLPLSEVTSDP
jgi:hypothetical protein